MEVIKDREMLIQCLDEEPLRAVEPLAQLRSLVDSWSKRASSALDDFGKERDDGSFWKDSRGSAGGSPNRPNITTTARAYIAKVAADRRRGQKNELALPAWAAPFRKFVSTPRVFKKESAYFEVAEKTPGHPREVQNYFDVAHLADFIAVSSYLARYYPSRQEGASRAAFAVLANAIDVEQAKVPQRDPEALAKRDDDERADTPKPPLLEVDKDPGANLLKVLKEALKDAVTPASGKYVGEVHFVKGQPESAHFFGTLHVLRAISILSPTLPTDIRAEVDEILEAVRAFAIAQSHYFHRSITSRQDPVRLAFAGCIYAIYDPHVDRDLCLAIVEALAQAQQPDGGWPATHPVIREGQVPWHISSHEVALCLTWLYFQPRVPDDARPTLLAMMHRYFAGSVVQTYHPGARRTATSTLEADRNWRGWQDDHTRSENRTVGWATAVVCHFLGNFALVLDDWINRRIIEELGLARTTSGYLIDETAPAPSSRWSHERSDSAVWPDLPPAGWRPDIPALGRLGEQISEKWTDPDDKKEISRKLGDLVIRPIFLHPAERPDPNRCAGLLPGQPGTRKTSLVGRMATVAEWPMVAVPASLIFARGFEMMEAEASRVFSLLNQLRRCIIFFDEFEEFFISRDKSAYHPVRSAYASVKRIFTRFGSDGDGAIDLPVAFESRTIAAFTTSAMLPRLQDLHNEDRCLVFLATNWLKKLDPAIIRRGRFDFMITVNHPSFDRGFSYILDLQRKATPKEMLEKEELVQHPYVEMRAALRSLRSVARKEILKFAVIEELERRARELMSSGIAGPALEVKLSQELRDMLTAAASDSPTELVDMKLPGATG